MIDGLGRYTEYKDSGLPWLDKIPNHWALERAKGLFQKMDRPSQLKDEVVTCFRDGTVTLRKNRRLTGFTESIKEIGYQGVRRGDLVIHAMDAFAGAVGVSDSDGKCTPVYAVCEPRRGANSYYYAHIIGEMSRSQWIAALARGIRERSTDFRFDDFAAQPVPFPPPDEQRGIANFLHHSNRRIDRYIRVKRKLIALLNEQKQAIIHRAVTRGLDLDVRLKPSGIPWLGEIPEHCSRTRLGRVCLSVRDGTHNPPPETPGSHRLLSVRNIIDGRFVTRADDRTMSTQAFEELQRSYTVNKGDVVIALVGATTGKSAVVEQMENVTVQRSLGILRPNTDVVDSHFLNLLIASETIQSQIRMIMDKYAAQPGIYLTELGRLQVVYPSVETQRRIIAGVGEQTKELDTSVDTIRREINLIHEYRIRLVADVVTGQLDVREAAAKLPEELAELERLDEVETVAEADDTVDDGIDTEPAEIET